MDIQLIMEVTLCIQKLRKELAAAMMATTKGMAADRYCYAR